jgi:hypothetical protein
MRDACWLGCNEPVPASHALSAVLCIIGSTDRIELAHLLARWGSARDQDLDVGPATHVCPST